MHLACTFHAFQREQQLSLSRRHGEFLDCVAISVAAAEVHPAVHARRVTLEHLLDEAYALEEFTPVERRNEAKAANQVGHAGLLGSLMLSLCSDSILNGLPACFQCRIQTAVECRGDRSERA